MADGFDEMITEARAFFTDLKANNTKDWFEPRKDTYTKRIKKPAELLADLFAENLERITGATMKPKVFRIYRDVRFSKDKTPYNAHLHISWFRPGAGERPGWFFGAAPEYLLLGTGLPGLSGPALAKFRAEIDTDGAELQARLAEAGRGAAAHLSDFGPEPLKRVPKPYAADHPQADLLKRKALFLQSDLPEEWAQDGLIASLRARAKVLHPVWQWLDEAMARPVA